MEEKETLTPEDIFAFFKGRNVSWDNIKKLKEAGFDESCSEVFKAKDYEDLGIKKAPAIMLYRLAREFLSGKSTPKAETTSEHQREKNPQIPRKFKKEMDEGSTYQVGHIIGAEEIGISRLARKMEFKMFWLGLEKGKEEDWIRRIVEFVSACINARQNGTLYFGISDGDKEHAHGEIQGIPFSTEARKNLHDLMDAQFMGPFPKKFSHVKEQMGQTLGLQIVEISGCADQRVIVEIDVEPTYAIWGTDPLYHDETEYKQAFVRKGTTSSAVQNWDKFLKGLELACAQRRKEEQEVLDSRKSKDKAKESKLRQLICRENENVEDHQYKYVLVTDSIKGKERKEFEWYGKINWNFILDLEPSDSNQKLVPEVMRDNFKFIDWKDVEQIMNSPKVNLLEAIEFGEYSRPWITIRKEASNFQDWVKSCKKMVSETINKLTSNEAQECRGGLIVIFIITNKDMLEVFRVLMQEFLSILEDWQMVFVSTDQQILEELGEKLEEQTWNKMSMCCDSWQFFRSFIERKLKIRSPATLKIPCSTGTSGITFPHGPEHESVKYIEVLGLNQSELLSEELWKSGQDNNTAADAALREFYRGCPPTWEVFFFSFGDYSGRGELPTIVKRTNVDNIIEDIQTFQDEEEQVCLIRIMHQPKAGASTIAMNVLWELKKVMRCVRVNGDEITANKDYVKTRLNGLINNLMNIRKFGEENTEDQNDLRTVLVLLDNSDDSLCQQLKDGLKPRLMKVNQLNSKCKFILLACCESTLSPHGELIQSSNILGGRYIKLIHTLSPEEIRLFKQALAQLDKQLTTQTIHTMLAFIIMANNFDEKSEYVIEHVNKALLGIEDFEKDHIFLVYMCLIKIYGSARHKGLPTVHCKILLDDQRPLVFKQGSIYSDVCNQVGLCIYERLKHAESVKYLAFYYVEITHIIVAELILNKLVSNGIMGHIEYVKTLFENQHFIDEDWQQKQVHATMQQLMLYRYHNETPLDQNFTSDSQQNFSKIITHLMNEKKREEAIELLKLAHFSLKDFTKPFFSQALARLLQGMNRFEESKSYGLQAVEECHDWQNKFPFYDTLGQIYKREIISILKLVKEGSIPGFDLTSVEFKDTMDLACQADEYFKLAMEHYNTAKTQNEEAGGDAPGILGRIDIRLTVWELILSTLEFTEEKRWTILLEFMKQPSQEQNIFELQNGMSGTANFQVLQELWNKDNKFIMSLYSESKSLLAAASQKLNHFRVASLNYYAGKFQRMFKVYLSDDTISQAISSKGILALIGILDPMYIRSFEWSLTRDTMLLEQFAYICRQTEAKISSNPSDLPGEEYMQQYKVCYVTCYMAQLYHEQSNMEGRESLPRDVAERYCFDLAKNIQTKKEMNYEEWPDIAVFYILLNINPQDSSRTSEQVKIFASCLNLLNEHYPQKTNNKYKPPVLFKLTNTSNLGAKLVNKETRNVEEFSYKGKLCLDQSLKFSLDGMEVILPGRNVIIDRFEKMSGRILDVRFNLRFSLIGPLALNLKKEDGTDETTGFKYFVS